MCGTMLMEQEKRMVVVAGGLMFDIQSRDCESDPKPSASTLMLMDETWFVGPDLPKALCCGQGVTGSSEERMFVIGGMDSDNAPQSDIYNLRCSYAWNCMWQKTQSSLDHPRMNFLALMLPDDFDLDCPSKNLDVSEDCYQTKALLVGDGFCDDSANIDGCLFDGGDCCHHEINAMFCKQCLCIVQQENRTQTTIGHKTGFSLQILTTLKQELSELLGDCVQPQWFNDTVCDSFNNVEVKTCHLKCKIFSHWFFFFVEVFL